jgi:hypothetical protein
MSDIDRSLKLLNDGRMAGLAAEHIGGLIAEFKQKKMMQLSQDFRMGKIDQATLLGSIAGLCALEDLEMEMKRRITRSEKISNEIHKEQLK